MPNWNTLNPSCQLEKLSSAAVSDCVKGNHFLDRDLYFAREQCVPISRTCSHNYFVKNSVKSTYLVHSVELSRFLYHGDLREINFEDSLSAKSADLPTLRGSEF